MIKPENIQTLAPLLALNIMDLEDHNFHAEEYNRFLNERQTKLGLFKKYLICKLHDSWVIETKLIENQFSIMLNDFSTHVFADAIISKFSLAIAHDDLIFPIEINFKSNVIVRYNKVDNKGNLHPTAPLKLDAYLYEQVISAEEKVKVVFNFWKSDRKKPGKDIILTVTADELGIIEKQDAAWQGIFGNKYDNYYKYFKEQFESDRYVSDMSVCLELIEEFDKVRVRT